MEDGTIRERLQLDAVLKNYFARQSTDSGAAVIAFGGLGLLHAGQFDRYAASTSIYNGLARLSPRLRPILELLEEKASTGEEGYESWRENFLVVCDSLPLHILEECIRSQAEGPIAVYGQGKVPIRAITLFAMESREMPDPMAASFPPDVQIKLGFRNELHSKRTRTIQILKSRFQEIRDEPFPFTIIDKGIADVVQSKIVQFSSIASGNEVAVEGERCRCLEPEKRYGFIGRRPGINVLRSLACAHVPSDGHEERSRQETRIKFGCPSIDELTSEHNLSGGSITLLATENRCHSSALSLHFLMGQIGEAVRDVNEQRASGPNSRKSPSSGSKPADGGSDTGREEDELLPYLPSSVLYISLDDDLIGVLHQIWCYALLRPAIWSGSEVVGCVQNPQGQVGDDAGQMPRWHLVEKLLREQQRETQRALEKETQRPATHHLHKIPLRHGSALRLGKECLSEQYGPFLYVLVPDLVWCGAEEVLEILRVILDGAPREDSPCRTMGHPQCSRIDRVVLNRVSRISANWPLIQNPTLLVSSLSKLCAERHVDLMVVDDTAVQSETTGHIESRWQNVARNIIRLRRVPFHGTEVVGMELVRTSGSNIRAARPMELRTQAVSWVREGEDSANLELGVIDTFRGYTGIFSGKLRRCKTTVDLSYDVKGSPLHLDGLNMQRNLKTIMLDDITVNVMGPEERPGVNSALSNLAHVSQDRCHVVSVDEVWLHCLIRGGMRASGLTPFSREELEEILPPDLLREECWTPRGENGGSGACHTPDLSFAKVGSEYVTQSLTIAARKARAEEKEEPFYAIPFRHNWSVLAVSRIEENSINLLPSWLQTLVGNTQTGPSPVSRVLSFIREDSPVGMPPTWDDLIAVKKQFADSRAPEGQIKFFDFVSSTDESIVCFLLELLLASARTSELFVLSEGGTPDFRFLRFKTNEVGQKGAALAETFERSLRLMFELLDQWQRHRIAFGPSTGADQSREQGQPPVSLFSREWLTTAPRSGPVRILVQDDRRDTIQREVLLRCLPVHMTKDKNVLVDALVDLTTTPNPLVSDGRKRREYEELCAYRGVPISGAWYLGTMSGGNRELATDIIRELVSQYHELDRLMTEGIAPVAKRFYRTPFLPAKGGDGAVVVQGFPYADVIRTLVEDERRATGSSSARAGTSISELFLGSYIVFPFCRTRIRNYTTISVVLCDLVRKAMALSTKDVEERNGSRFKTLVAVAVNRIRDIQERAAEMEERVGRLEMKG